MQHAILSNGEPVLITPRPMTVGDTQHPRQIFNLWPRADKLALGIYEVVYPETPGGMRATGWTYTVEGDHVAASTEWEPIPPTPVEVTAEMIARVLAAPADPGEALTVGHWYNAGDTITHEGQEYEVTRAFLYADPNWRPEHLQAHLVAINTGSEWIAGEAVSVGDERTYQGTTYRVIQAHTTQAGWEPPNTPALWEPV